MPFSHENLKVYQQTLVFNAKVCTWIDQWDCKHALRDQLSRAAGSILENIAMASATFSAMKTRNIDYAIGSSLECAACLDLARVKRLLDKDLVCEEKEDLAQILRMLVGLRKSWVGATHSVREDCAEYKIELTSDKECDNSFGQKVLFHHEKLDVYRVAIAAAEAFYSAESISRLSNPVFRRLDELLTSMILNIAEGNGRYSAADQTRFLGTSHESAIKLAARFDLCVTQGFLLQNEVSEWKVFLERVSAMTLSMIKNAQT